MGWRLGREDELRREGEGKTDTEKEGRRIAGNKRKRGRETDVAHVNIFAPQKIPGQELGNNILAFVTHMWRT